MRRESNGRFQRRGVLEGLAWQGERGVSRLDAAGVSISALAAIMAVALAARAPLAVLLPVLTPDGVASQTVAANILLNGCISLSDPAGAACVPHWGGNHPPGYPGFLALTWAIFGQTDTPALILQSAIFALAVGWLVRATVIFTDSRAAALAVGLIAALSPVQLAWARFVLPETLSLAVALWVLAEIMLSLHEQRLRWASLGLGLAAAVFLRYDGILLSVPVAACGFMIHRPLRALVRGAPIALIVVAPLGVWSAHNVARGLPFIPQPRIMQDGSPAPEGYRDWGRTWIATIYQGADMAYPAWSKNYGAIRINPRAYDSPAERGRVEALLADLEEHEGQTFPADIDAEFATLAAERRERAPLRHWVGLPLTRTAVFWLNPFYSYGWPLEIRNGLSEDESLGLGAGASGLIGIALAHPLESFGKAAIAGYRYVMVALAAWVGIAVFLRPPSQVRRLVALALGYALARTLALSFQASIDNRYMVTSLAWVEVAIVVAFVSLHMWRRGKA